MTTLREAAEKALEALEDMLGWESLAPQSVQDSSRQSLQRLREALAQPEPEPVVWQFRMRPDWVLDKDFWEPWTNCTKEQAADYQRVPHLHDWTYESRALFTHPPQSKPLTNADLEPIRRRIMGFAYDAADYGLTERYNAIKVLCGVVLVVVKELMPDQEKMAAHLTEERLDYVAQQISNVASACVTEEEPQRKPLTDEELVDIVGNCAADSGGWFRYHAFARAIERAHGIGGKE